SAGKVVTQKSRQKGHWKSLISYTVTGASALPLVREPRSWAAAGVARTAHSDSAAARRKAVTRAPVRVSFCHDGRTRPGPVLKLPTPTRILLVLQLILTQVALGQGVEALFPERPAGMVNDIAGVVPDDVEAGIESRLVRLRDSTGGEVAVVILPTIGDRAPVDVAVAIGRRWGVGGKFPVGDPRRNAGVVMLLVPRSDDRS